MQITNKGLSTQLVSLYLKNEDENSPIRGLHIDLVVTNLGDGRYMIAEVDGDTEYQRIVVRGLEYTKLKVELEEILLRPSLDHGDLNLEHIEQIASYISKLDL